MSENRVYNVLIVGVGGQGIILASDVLGRVAARHGYDVKKNEIHGMAQRGGSVSSHIRFGKSVSSPIIKAGEADVLLSFEQIETLRYFHYLSEKGKVIVNDQKILPPAVFTGKQEYPPDVLTRIKEKVPDAVVVDGAEVARQMGNPQGAQRGFPRGALQVPGYTCPNVRGGTEGIAEAETGGHQLEGVP